MKKFLCQHLCVCLLLYAAAYPAQESVVSIPSQGLKRSFKATIVTPDEYKNSTNHFSVAYLLHGYSGDYSTWSKVVSLDAYADKYRIIFVCPDGNFNSWYIDSPIKPESQFESYIVKDVVTFIDKNYRTWAVAKGRVLIGSSMGGHGATTLLARRPDLFCGAGSISGIMELSEFPGQWDLSAVLGDNRENAAVWKENSFLTLCEKLGGLNKGIILDCGVSDFALAGNRKAHEKLIALGIRHEYYERPGGHDSSYARTNLEFHLLFFSRMMLGPGK